MTIGLALVGTTYRGTNAVYEWRCEQAGHGIKRSKGNIQQSLRRGHPACNICGPAVAANVQARRKHADDFAMTILPVIAHLKEEGYASLEALAGQLNKHGIATMRGKRWYASTVKNVVDRSKALGCALTSSSTDKG